MSSKEIRAANHSFSASNAVGPTVKRINLPALCSDLLLIVIRMLETPNLGNPVSLRKLILVYLNFFVNKCKEHKIDANWILDTEYAIVALLDETILNIEGECRNHWIKQPVQLDIFQTSIAGEQFYTKLNKLLVNPDKNSDVLEVYYLCLSLGFEGKYRVYNQLERNNIIYELGQKLRIAKNRNSNKLSFHIKSAYPHPDNKLNISKIRFGIIFTFTAILVTYLILLIIYHLHIQNLLEALK